MTKPAVYVARRLPGPALEYLREHCEMQVWDGDRPVPADTIRDRASTCDGLLTLLTERVDEALLSAAPQLRVVSNMATGFDNINLEAATKHGVLVTRTPGVLSGTTADFAFAILLAAARRIPEGDRYVRAGKWKTWGPEILLGQDVHGATIGIIGMGGIGQEMAKRAAGFGMRILYNSRTRKPAVENKYGAEYKDVDALLADSDFVSLHAPLSADTRHLIDERALKLMKPTAVLVNTARGPLVDQSALFHALTEGWIAAAALDVTDPEPISHNDPLLKLDNFVVAPHVASASVATRSRMAMMAAEQLVEALAGRIPPNSVNPEAWSEGPP